MKYIETAFGQLSFAIKLMQAAEDGAINMESIDRPLTIDEGTSLLVLPDKVLDSPDDLILACQNNVTIAFGAAAITLNRCREEAGVRLPDPVNDERDQWVGLVYQIRNAFAHDIAEPRWNIPAQRFAREYRVGLVCADLTSLHGLPFNYSHIGGVDGLFLLKTYGDANVFGSGATRDDR